MIRFNFPPWLRQDSYMCFFLAQSFHSVSHKWWHRLWIHRNCLFRRLDLCFFGQDFILSLWKLSWKWIILPLVFMFHAHACIRADAEVQICGNSFLFIFMPMGSLNCIIRYGSSSRILYERKNSNIKFLKKICAS